MRVKAFSSGLTLLELIVGLAVLGILAALTLPDLNLCLRRWQLRAAAEDLRQNLESARSQAALCNRNCAVALVRGADSASSGYLVFEDVDGDLRYGQGDRLLCRVYWRDYPAVIPPAASWDKDPAFFIGFRPNGISINGTGGFGADSLELFNRDGAGMKVIIAKTGRIRIAKAAAPGP